MNREDIQKLVEGIFSLHIQSSEANDREDYGAARSLDDQADALETMLGDAGYTIEEDKDNLDSMRILASDGTLYASFDLAEWQWIQEA